MLGTNRQKTGKLSHVLSFRWSPPKQATVATNQHTGISGVAFGLVHKSCKMYRSPNGLVKFKLGGGGLATLSTTKLYGKSW